jgi:hypothetical protein
MKKILLLSALISGIVFTHSLQAQAKKTADKPAKTTPPKLKTFLSNMTGGAVSADGMIKLVQEPLLIKDEKGNTLTVVKFIFSWTTKDVFEDPETGEKKSHINNFTRQINGSDISAELKETLINEIKTGDLISYDQIMVKNKEGLKFLAPPISFTVK